VAAAALLALFGPVTSAPAAHVSCGETIEADTTLDADVLGCPNNGVVIDASGVTLDLAGHTIEGTRRGFGVVTGVGASRVTVKNGKVGRFHNAVVLVAGGDHVVRDVRVYDSHDGVLLNSVGGALLERVTATGNDGSGIHTPVSRNVTIRRSHIHDNAAGVGGLGLQGSAIVRNTIERNTFYGILYGSVTGSTFERNLVYANGGFGIMLIEGSTGNRFIRNRVSKTVGDGMILAEDSAANLLYRNRFNRNTGDGVEVLGAGATLIRNSAARNGALGINAPAGAAVARRNRARHNGDPRECVGVPCQKHAK
jgi:hypothetical protein